MKIKLLIYLKISYVIGKLNNHCLRLGKYKGYYGKENLTVLSDIIISMDDFNEKKKDENLVFDFSNFKYSYHGIPNKHLFENVVKIKGSLKNQFDSKIYLILQQETLKKKVFI